MVLAFSIVSLLLANIPFWLFLRNVSIFRRARREILADLPRVSVLIPARNEEASISACVECVLASQHVELELIVLNDHSTDQTSERVKAIAEFDSRVSLHDAPDLPDGWCGKQHACHVLSTVARGDWLCFVDADVRLQPDALTRAVAFATDAGAGLVSGFPRQEVGTFFERLLIPLMHFILLGFLPLSRMRASVHPAYGAGCGQFFVADANAYRLAGGHASIRGSLHDGVTLPRVFRRAGIRTDLFDATDICRCRMYRSAGQVWHGLAKNATEGMASAAAIGPWTVVLGLGQVVPVILVGVGIFQAQWGVVVLSSIALLMGLIPRLIASRRFCQPVLGALLHPAGVAILLVIQWFALCRDLLGVRSSWKGRAYGRVRTG